MNTYKLAWTLWGFHEIMFSSHLRANIMPIFTNNLFRIDPYSPIIRVTIVQQISVGVFFLYICFEFD